MPGSDITPEAALAKLSYVLSKPELSQQERRKLMETNLVGEMTVIQFQPSEKAGNLTHAISTESLSGADTEELDLIEAVAKQLRLKTSKEIQGLRQVLFPSILCAMVHAGVPTAKLEVLRVKHGADMAMVNYDGRTPLHVAACQGRTHVVDYLMRNGAGVHVKDVNNESPLMCAINAEQEEIVKALKACGAHLQLSPLELGEKLSSFARLGTVFENYSKILILASEASYVKFGKKP